MKKEHGQSEKSAKELWKSMHDGSRTGRVLDGVWIADPKDLRKSVERTTGMEREVLQRISHK